jgi:hypothetical protein
MKIYASDLVDFLNRDWGTGTLGCVNLDYLNQFTEVKEGKFSPPNDPDAEVDLDELDAVAVNIILKENGEGTKPYKAPVITLVRLCQMLGIRAVGQVEPPSQRNQPKLNI